MPPNAHAAAFAELVAEVLRLHAHLADAGDLAATPSGLTGARSVVLQAASRGELPVASLARVVRQRRQSVQQTVEALLADGFVELRPNPHHRRAPLVVPTARGRRALQEVGERQGAWAGRVAAPLEERALRDAARVLRRASELLEQMETE